MAVALTLDDWRAQLDSTVPRPDVLTKKQLSRLTATAREEYDETRRRWIAAGQMVPTHDFEQIKRLARLVVADSTYGATTARAALSVSGSAGMGKTSALQWVARHHEHAVRERRGLPLTEDAIAEHGRETVLGFAPAVYVVLPSTTTPKALMETFLHFVGRPARSGATTTEMTSIVTDTLRALGTSMVVVDDLHRLRTKTSAGGESANHLKSFAEGLDAAFLYAGIDLTSSSLFSGLAGAQLYDRTTPYVMRGYKSTTSTNEDRNDEWTELVARLEALLPLTDHTSGTLVALADDLKVVTNSSLGRLRRLFRHAANEAIYDNSERITAATLHSVEPEFPAPSRKTTRKTDNATRTDDESAVG